MDRAVVTGLKERYATGSARVNALRGQRDMLDKQVSDCQGRLRQANEQSGYHDEAQMILQALEEKWRGNAGGALASVVSYGLSVVFGEPYELNIDSKVSRGVASTELTLTKSGLRTPIKNAKGGSVLNVLSFLFHTILTTSSKPRLRPILVLDEPFSHVSAEYRPQVCALLRELCHRLGLQMIIVSHEEELLEAADVAYLVELPEGKTAANVTCIKGRNEVQE